MKNRGFTLLETMVAITVITFVIMGPMTLAARSIAVARYSSNQVVATYLAQEGLEFVRYVRDNNAINGEPWLTHLVPCINIDETTNKRCTVDPTNSTKDALAIFSCDGTCQKVQYKEGVNGEPGLYGYWTPPEEPSIFTREIKITSVSADERGAWEVKVISKVSWKEKFSDKSIILETNLLDSR